jgi:hypothetical protein
VHHLLLVNLFEAVNQLTQDDAGLEFRETATSNLCQVFKVTSVTQLHDEVEVVLCSLNVIELDDIRTFHFRQNIDFIFQVVK